MQEVTQGVESGNIRRVRNLAYTVIENSAVGLQNSTDLVSGQYEGGLRLWECASDLVDYLSNLSSLPSRVLELGCGQGLPGLFCAQRGSTVTFQDFNREVIEFATINNAIKNEVREKCRFFYGPWGDTSSLGTFDLVLTSETIYNTEIYAGLLNAIRTSGANQALVACKNYYFGIGGGAELFCTAATALGINSEIVLKIEEIASIRLIIRLTW
jgi:2-polyprenyl-3-methyl-5-hydroxy-6-metoxy-1,4-benzoquinol methylase